MSNDKAKDDKRLAGAHALGRRGLLGSALALAAVSRLVHPAAADTEPRKAPPQAGDQLVFAQGERKGQVIRPEDLPLGGPQQLAFPKDPASDTIRNGSRLNQLAVVRLPPDELSADTEKVAADGVVAYGATCSHQGCPVSMWKSANSALYCSCHGSEFDPRDNARVVKGPAPRRLTSLPLALEDGVLTVAGPFTGRVGPQKA